MATRKILDFRFWILESPSICRVIGSSGYLPDKKIHHRDTESTENGHREEHSVGSAAIMDNVFLTTAFLRESSVISVSLWCSSFWAAGTRRHVLQLPSPRQYPLFFRN